MKKSIIAAIILIIVMISLAYTINNSRIQKVNLTKLDNNIEKIKLINKDFDLYLQNRFEYNNFDVIGQDIDVFTNNLNKILDNKILNEKFSEILSELRNLSLEKMNKISKVNSYKAILNNSFRIIQKLKKKIDTKEFDDLYVSVLILDKNPELSVKSIQKSLKKFKYTSKHEEYFFKHIDTILNYQTKLIKLQQSINQLNLNDKLNTLHLLYKKHTSTAIEKAHISIGILFALLIVLIAIYLIYAFKLIILNSQLSKFKSTVENSDNIVVITDKDENITYVNEEFTKTTGYTAEEAIGKKPSILKSGKQSKEFYDELHETLHSGKKWSGEFINVDKYGELSYEKASISPLFDDDGQIKEFIAIKLDITSEVIKGQQLKEKEKLLIQQSKMATIGEMLESISHQWRQPLSIISTAATGIIAEKEFGICNEKNEIERLNKINNSVQYLSETINDFKDFFKPNNEKSMFILDKTYSKALKMVYTKFESDNIEVIENLINVEVNGFENEVIQVLMTILNNARDAFDNKEEQRRLVFVKIYKQDNNAIIEIQDNAGGIPENIIDKIFEPYFTTKHQSVGRGIALYMSYEMLTIHMNGTLEARNVSYDYENVNYNGARITIVIPL